MKYTELSKDIKDTIEFSLEDIVVEHTYTDTNRRGSTTIINPTLIEGEEIEIEIGGEYIYAMVDIEVSGTCTHDKGDYYTPPCDETDLDYEVKGLRIFWQDDSEERIELDENICGNINF